MSTKDERDSVNPFSGGGYAYWEESVPSVVQAGTRTSLSELMLGAACRLYAQVVQAWSTFNGCKETMFMLRAESCF